MRVKRINNNHEIIQNENEIIFISYESIVAKIKNNQLILGNDWDYSKTTLKYLYQFLDKYFINEEIDEAMQKANKKEALQKLIDKKIIILDKTL